MPEPWCARQPDLELLQFFPLHFILDGTEGDAEIVAVLLQLNETAIRQRVEVLADGALAHVQGLTDG